MQQNKKYSVFYTAVPSKSPIELEVDSVLQSIETSEGAVKLKISFGLQAKIILLVCSLVTVVLLVTSMLISRVIEDDIRADTARQALSVARMIARSPVVVNGLLGQQDAASAIQQYANDSKEASNVQFITILDMNGIRKSHPDPAKVGQHVEGGDESEVLAGKEYLSIAKGTLGYSLRGFTPVYGPDGTQIGAVLVGIMMDRVQQAIHHVQLTLAVVTLAGMAAGIAGALVLSRNVKKTLFGLEPEEIAKLLEQRSVMLQSVREGIIAVDGNGNVTLINEAAKRLLNLTVQDGDPIGKSVNNFVPNTRLLEVIKSGQAELNQEQDFGGVSILTNRVPLVVDGRVVGAIATFKDKTEIKRLAEELTGVRNYVEALRSQSHEFMNRLHVILGLVRLESYDQLAAYINQIASDHQAEVTFVDQRIRDHVIAGFILSKLSLARENNVVMRLSENSFLPRPENQTMSHELVTIISNLIENAFDAVKHSRTKEVDLSITFAAETLRIIVRDSGKGVPAGIAERIFERGISDKGSQRGIGLYLVRRSLDRLQGSIDFTTIPETGTVFRVNIPYESRY